MLKKTLIIVIPAIFITVFVLAGVKLASKDVILTAHVKNSYSKQWVYGAKISVGNKVIYRYATTPFEIRGLEKGSATLKIEAPDYEPQSIQIDLKRGENRIDDILLRPLRIPDLQKIYVFVQPQRDYFKLEIRLANSENTAILHAPHLPLHIFCILYTQIGDKEDKKKGRVIYQGHPDIVWDYNFASIFPLSAKINYKDIAEENTGKYVLDTMIIVPNESYSLDENSELFSLAGEIYSKEKLLNFIHENELKSYKDTTWDIEEVY
jgi:hypothetical protein